MNIVGVYTNPDSLALTIGYADGSFRTVDPTLYLAGPLLAAVAAVRSVYDQAYVNVATQAVVWPNGAYLTAQQISAMANVYAAPVVGQAAQVADHYAAI